VIRPCRSSSGRSSLPNYSMRAMLGGWRFTNAIYRQQVNAFFRCSRPIRCGNCSRNLPPFENLCQAADQQLFSNILNNSGHLLNRFPSPHNAGSQNYDLRIRPHNRQLTLHSGHLTDRNIFTRKLYANIYRSNSLLSTYTNNNLWDNFFIVFMCILLKLQYVNFISNDYQSINQIYFIGVSIHKHVQHH